MNLSQVFTKVFPSVAALAIKSSTTIDGKSKVYWRVFGSAVCVDPRGIYLTARHCVVEDNDDISEITELDQFSVVRAWFNEKYNEYQSFEFVNDGLTLIHGDSDVAAVTAPKNNNIKYPYIKVAKVEKVLRVGQEVGCLGFPVTGKEELRTDIRPNLFSGIISRIDYQKVGNDWTLKNIVFDMSLHPGCSGGPVFDEDGDLIAIVSSQEERKAEFEEDVLVWTNLIHCVPFHRFSKMIERVNEYDREK